MQTECRSTLFIAMAAHGFLGYDHQSLYTVSQYQTCTNVYYKLRPSSDINGSYGIIHLSTTPYDNDRVFHTNKDNVKEALDSYKQKQSFALITTPVYINITLLECPPGFSLRVKNSTRFCDCYHELRIDIQCHIDNNNVFLWSSNAWIGVDANANNITSITEISKVLYNNNCPLDYCGDFTKNMDYMRTIDPDDQCASNRAGRLCGGCLHGFSLAIGSSRCIPCSSNS